MRYRIFNKLYAFFKGYFWLPCPICNKYFGGHESSDETLMISHHSGRGVCRDCGDKLK